MNHGQEQRDALQVHGGHEQPDGVVQQLERRQAAQHPHAGAAEQQVEDQVNEVGLQNAHLVVRKLAGHPIVAVLGAKSENDRVQGGGAVLAARGGAVAVTVGKHEVEPARGGAGEQDLPRDGGESRATAGCALRVLPYIKRVAAIPGDGVSLETVQFTVENLAPLRLALRLNDKRLFV